jgi:predicted nuclease of predicted toxin-antitoxin system
MTSFLADENVPPAIVEFLRQKGFDVKEARELGIPGTPDTMIMELMPPASNRSSKKSSLNTNLLI